MLIIVAALIVINIQRYKRSLANKLERQKLLADLKGLEMKTLRLQLNPHFLFNCLNSIKGFIADNQPKEARRQITNFSKLMRAYLDYSSQKWIDISAEISMLNQYVELEKMLRENTFNINFEGDINNYKIPTMLLQPFIENSIKHGFNSSTRNGLINIHLKTQDNKLLCEIVDNGLGYHYKKPSDHESKALSIIHERLDVLGSISNNSFGFQIEDTGTGTRIELILPIERYEAK